METVPNEYTCIECNLQYKTNNGLWKHNKKYHVNSITTGSNIGNISSNDSSKKYTCIKCNKEYNNKFSKYKHQLKCKLENNIITKNDIIELKEKITGLETKINNMNNKPSKKFINNGTIVNGTNNSNKLVINKIGTENVLELNDMEITDIFNKEIEGVIKLIEFVNFNERLHLFLGKFYFPKNKDGL